MKRAHAKDAAQPQSIITDTIGGTTMPRSLAVLSLSLLLALPGFAQDEKKENTTHLTGYVVDAMCAKGMAKKDNPMEKAAMHTKKCSLEEGCAASGFGVFSDGKWYKFDEKGDAMAIELIKASKAEKGIMVEAIGEMKGDVFAVTAIGEQPARKKD
jgi:hypothetical protein